MNGQREKLRRSARTNQQQQSIGIGIGIGSGGTRRTNDDAENSDLKAFMEAYETYRASPDHTDEECRTMVASYIDSTTHQTLSTKTMIVPRLGITVPTPIVEGGASSQLLRMVEDDYVRARRAGRGGAASDVGASSWRARDHKRMEGAVVGPGAEKAGRAGADDNDDATSVAISDDTISVGSGYTARPDEEGDKVPATGLERSYLLGGSLTKSSSGVKLLTSTGEKRDLASILSSSTQPSQFVTPLGRFTAKRLKIQETRSDWNGLDPNLLHDVFSRLNLREKVRCMGKVCRAWNELRTRPGMFADLSDDSGPNCMGMRRLIEWLPPDARSSVTGIRLHSLDGYDETFGMIALDDIAKAKGNTLSAIEKVVFSGPGIDAYKTIARSVILGAGPSLKSLTFDQLSSRNAERLRSVLKPDFLLDLLRNSSGLRELKMPPTLLPKEGLACILSAIGTPDVTSTNLTVLDLTMRTSDEAGPKDLEGLLELPELDALAMYCPELREINVPDIPNADFFLALVEGEDETQNDIDRALIGLQREMAVSASLFYEHTYSKRNRDY